MDTHINRLLVLRPQLSEAERVEFLVGVFSYLGDGYDFKARLRSYELLAQAYLV